MHAIPGGIPDDQNETLAEVTDLLDGEFDFFLCLFLSLFSLLFSSVLPSFFSD